MLLCSSKKHFENKISVRGKSHKNKFFDKIKKTIQTKSKVLVTFQKIKCFFQTKPDKNYFFYKR